MANRTISSAHRPTGSASTDFADDPSPFAALGRFVVRFRFLIVIAWLVAALAVSKTLPSLSSVSSSDNSSFLPSSEPSIRAAALAAPFQRGSQQTALLVAARSDGPLTAGDQAAVTRAEAAVAAVAGVAGVRDQGLSSDGKARKALVEPSARSFLGGAGGSTLVDAIRTTLGGVHAPAGLSLYLTGELATLADSQSANDRTLAVTELLSVVFILVLLLVVYRSPLAPVLTLLPAGLAVIIAEPLIAEAHSFGVQVSSLTQILLVILVLGAGTDYGLFLIFRVREELQRGLDPHAAVVTSVARVGETITFSAGTVIGALLCLLLASLGLYHGLGPALAIAIAVLLLAGLTLTPALVAIAGRATFWPLAVQPGALRRGIWGRMASRIIQRPVRTLGAGVLIFGCLALAVLHYAPAGFTQNGAISSSSQSARGTSILNAHFPAAQANPTNLLLRYRESVWDNPAVLTQADRQLRGEQVFSAISGPLDPNGATLTASRLISLHAALGPAAALPPVRPAGATIAAPEYNAYRATAQFIGADGHTVQFYATLRAGAPDSTGAMQAIPAVRRALERVSAATGAVASGVAGQAASSNDISSVSTSDLQHVLPVVLLVIALLLGLVLRSLVAPWYLIASVGLSYLAALGLAVIVFMGLGGGPGLNFVLPFFMFIFIMALGSDYNILVMTRIREEAQHYDVRTAVTHAVDITGGTVTAAGLILAGSFAVLTVSAGGQIQQVGFSIAAGILMDTFLIRTLLIPSLVVLLGRWNWWPSALSRRGNRPVPVERAATSEVA